MNGLVVLSVDYLGEASVVYLSIDPPYTPILNVAFDQLLVNGLHATYVATVDIGILQFATVDLDPSGMPWEIVPGLHPCTPPLAAPQNGVIAPFIMGMQLPPALQVLRNLNRLMP